MSPSGTARTRPCPASPSPRRRPAPVGRSGSSGSRASAPFGAWCGGGPARWSYVLAVIGGRARDRAGFLLTSTVLAAFEPTHNCLAAERYWDQARWATVMYAWRFDGLDERLGGRGGLMLAIHPNARTTPAVRAEIARSARAHRRAGPALRRQHRDRSQVAQTRARPPPRPFSASAQAALEGERGGAGVVCALRRATGFPLDDLTFVVPPLPAAPRPRQRLPHPQGRGPEPPAGPRPGPRSPRPSSRSTSSASSTWT